MDDKGCTWESEETRRMLIEASEQFFNEEIRWQDWKKMQKGLHKNVKKFCNYKAFSGLMNTRKGPITDPEDFLMAREGDLEWEDARVYR